MRKFQCLLNNLFKINNELNSFYLYKYNLAIDKIEWEKKFNCEFKRKIKN